MGLVLIVIIFIVLAVVLPLSVVDVHAFPLHGSLDGPSVLAMISRTIALAVAVVI